MCPQDDQQQLSAADIALDQRLRGLRGSGRAPQGHWQVIAAALDEHPVARPTGSSDASISPSKRQPKSSPNAWAWASAAVLFLSIGLSLVNRTPWTDTQQSSDEFVAQNWDSAVLSSSHQALNQLQQGLAYEWPLLLHSASALNTALISPELNALERSRRDLQDALRQNPDSPQLMHQLARLDQWQARLIHQLGHEERSLYPAAAADV